MELTELDRREWFREHWVHGVPFNRHCGIDVRRWDDEAVELFLPYAEVLSVHAGIFHGGVVSALLDTTGSGAGAACTSRRRRRAGRSRASWWRPDRSRSASQVSGRACPGRRQSRYRRPTSPGGPAALS